MVGGKKFCHNPSLLERLTAFIEQHKAGSPTDPNVYWISLRPRDIARLFRQESQAVVSHGMVKRLLKELGYRYRKQSKVLSTGSYEKRDQQFLIIMNLILIMSLQTPVLSIDCKKKERLGNLYRAGKCYCTGVQKVFDHDYDYLAEGKVIPHGIYDLQANKGFISIGNSHETARFIIDNLRWWWYEYGIHQYPMAKNILILCDSGGANSYRHHAFKLQLLELATELGISIIIAHYPPYSSKWNPIEHRLFCHVHAAISGKIFSDYQTVKELIEHTCTDSGLSVVVRLNLKIYETKVKFDKSLMDTNRILHNPIIPELSYRIFP